MQNNLSKVAIFGHQRKGLDNESYMRGGNYIGLGLLSGFSLYIDGGLPVIRPQNRRAAPHGATVVVDIYEVSPAILARLDVSEGYCPSQDGLLTPACFADRQLLLVQGIDKAISGRLFNCYVYVYTVPVFADAVRVPSGDLVDHLSRYRHQGY